MTQWPSLGRADFDRQRLLVSAPGVVPTPVPSTLPNSVPAHKLFDVTVIWGIRPAKSAPWIGVMEENWRYDPDFEPSDPWAQRALRSMCTEMPDSLAWHQR